MRNGGKFRTPAAGLVAALALTLAACEGTPITAPTAPERDALDVPGLSAAVIVNEQRTGPITVVREDVCNAEDVAITVFRHLVIRSTDDGDGGFHFGFSQTFYGTAVGLTSGRQYRFAQNLAFDVNARPPFPHTETFTNKGVLVALDPDAQNIVLRILGHLTIDATGEVTTEIDDVRVACR